MKNNGQTSEDNRDSGVLSNPISFVRSGNFNWGGAGLSGRGGNGNDWSLRSANTTNSSSLSFDNTYLNPQYNSGRGNGFAGRCKKNNPQTLKAGIFPPLPPFSIVSSN